MKRFNLTDEYKAVIRARYLTDTLSEIAKLCGCSREVIGRFMKSEGLVISKELRYEKQRARTMGRTTLTEYQQAFIRQNYLALPVKQMADRCAAGYTAVNIFMKRNNLVIPPAIVERNRESARIKPGNTPMNKGKKQSEFMSAEAIARTKTTQFQKGNVPHNSYHEDGVITVRVPGNSKNNPKPYKYIRLGLGRWKELHRYIWEQAHGPIPKGMVIRFKDGNTLNADLENLELISRREHYRKNSSHEILSDRHMANLVAWRDPELKEELLKHPEILDIKRKELLLSRAIKKQLQNGK